jgi:Arc/MetJ family transcription regulator
LHVSALSHTPSPGSPHAAPDAANALAGHAPAPSHFSTTSQSLAAARHVNVVGSLFTTHEPEALHVSGLSQTVSLALPHAVPVGSNASAGHAPAPLQFSATSHSPASARHRTVVGSLFARHVPVELHESGLSQTVSLALPHAVPEGSNTFAGQLPAPSQFSATSHAPASARHTTDVGSLFTWQAPELLHVSGLSQTVSLALPHAVPEGSNASAGHAPAPLQFSATSHAPASARQTTLVGSLFAAHTPEALHVSGLSQTVSLALPHAVPEGSNPFAGQLPAPSQFSATSHSPASARHVVVFGS